MPNNFFSVDSRFPSLEGKPQSEINAEMRNYLFMLLEQLRYTLGNLGAANFNETELDGIAEMISSPIYARLESTEGSLSELTLTAEGLSSRVSDAEGNISTLTQTANGISARVGQAELAINNLGIQMAGRVTFEALAGNGTTVINGSNIKTGTISAVDIDSCRFTSGDNLFYMELDDGAISFYSHGTYADNIVGGLYNDGFGRFVIGAYGGYTLTMLGNPQILYGNTYYDALHAGNILNYISANAAAVKAVLGI
jgi:hypothetical protein